MYFIGWFTFVSSGALASEQLSGIMSELGARIESGDTTLVAAKVVASMSSNTNILWVVTVNVTNYVLLVAVIGFLFFWKPPKDGSEMDSDLLTVNPKAEVDGQQKI